MNLLLFGRLWLLAGLLTTAAYAQEKKVPAYLEHGADAVQKEYSKAILGFAIEKKCSFLAPSAQAAYEAHLDLATRRFQGYVLAKRMAEDPDQALKYPKDMVFGAIRFATMMTCDASSKKLVDRGSEVARDFKKVIDEAE